VATTCKGRTKHFHFLFFMLDFLDLLLLWLRECDCRSKRLRVGRTTALWLEALLLQFHGAALALRDRAGAVDDVPGLRHRVDVVEGRLVVVLQTLADRLLVAHKRQVVQEVVEHGVDTEEDDAGKLVQDGEEDEDFGKRVETVGHQHHHVEDRVHNHLDRPGAHETVEQEDLVGQDDGDDERVEQLRPGISSSTSMKNEKKKFIYFVYQSLRIRAVS